MGSWNRVWIFFVIVAVGLVLSWGQIGRKAEQRLSGDATALLRTEVPCAPRQAPCAATGADFGLVLGPDGPAALQLRAVGAPQSELAEVWLRAARGAGGEWQLQPERLGPDAWRLKLPAAALHITAELQLRLARPAVSAVFPLPPAGGQ